MADDTSPSKEAQRAAEKIKALEARQEKLRKNFKNFDEISEKALDDQLAKLGKLLTAREKIGALAEKRVEAMADEIKVAEELAALAQQNIDRLEQEIKKANALEEVNEDMVKLLERRLSAYEAEKVLVNETLADQKEVAKKLEEQAKATASILANMEHSARIVKDKLLAGLFGMNDVTQAVGTELTHNGKILTNTAKKTSKILGDMGRQVTKANLVGAAYEKGFEGAVQKSKELDQYLQQFGMSAAISSAEKYHNQIKLNARATGIASDEAMLAQDDMFDSMVKGSINTQAEAWNTHQAFFKTSAAYRQASTEIQTTAGDLGMALEKRLGIPTTETAGMFQELTTTFHKTGKEANTLTADLAMMARTQKMDVNKYFGDFQQMSSNLAKFGLPDIKKEFNALAVIQEKTGASMHSLVGAMDTFSTFEGALNASSKLNAAFGTTIDGMEIMDTLMKEGPAKSMLLLRQRLEETGTSFEDMNYAQKRAMADASGMDMGTLQKFMSTPFTELEEAVAKSGGTIEGTKESLAAFKGEAKDNATAQEKMNKALEEQRENMQGIGRLLNDMKLWYAENANPWVKFGVSLATSFGGVIPNIIGVVVQMKAMGALRVALSAQQKALNAADAASAVAGQEVEGSAIGRTTKKQITKNIAKGAGLALKGPVGWGMLAVAGVLIAGLAAYLGYSAAKNQSHAVGTNFASQPQTATVGEAGAPEIATIGGEDYLVGQGGPEQVSLGAGDKVRTVDTKATAGGGGMPREIVMNFTFIDDNGAKKTERIRKEFMELMNENLQFSYS
jgi:hypothetical protein